ncbi:MAG: extracellular solute-binding protein [Chloroflexota bacterium]
MNQTQTIRITAEVTTAIPTPENTPELDLTLEPIDRDELVPTQDPSIDLIVWLSPDIQANGNEAANEVFQTQIDQFLDSNPNIDLKVEFKVPVGQGGMINYFQTARTIAPSILPDLILVPSDQIEEFINLEAGFSIDEYITEDQAGDFFPAASQMGQIEGGWYGYPYVATGLTHVAYNPTVITETLGVTWDEFSETSARMVFPASGSTGAQLLYELYSTEGGSIYDEEGGLAIDEDTLARSLQLIQDGRQSGLILNISESIASEQESWLAYQQGEADMLFTSAERFLVQRQTNEDLQFSSVPSSRGPVVSQVEGWVWLISTPDPVRQQAASQLMIWLSNSGNLAEWSFVSNHIPIKRSAIAAWPEDPFSSFVTSEMERAVALDRTARGTVLDSFETALRILFSSESPNVQSISEQIAAEIN